MDQFERQKQLRQALNGKMFLMFGGIFLMFSAITSTLMYGINFFTIALGADKGTTEYVELLEQAGIGSTFLKVAGVCFILDGIWEIVVGFFAAKNSNRVDKSKFTLKMIISLLVVEALMQVYLFFTGLTNLGFLFTAILLPLVMLWGVTRLRKIAKAEPDRKFAVDPAKNKNRQPSQQPVAPKKSIRERAAMQARVNDTAENEVVEDTSEPTENEAVEDASELVENEVVEDASDSAENESAAETSESQKNE